MSYDFTANMENVLDQIASGEKNWKEELNQFFKDFSTQLSTAELDELEGGMKPNSLVLNRYSIVRLVAVKWPFVQQAQVYS